VVSAGAANLAVFEHPRREGMKSALHRAGPRRFSAPSWSPEQLSLREAAVAGGRWRLAENLVLQAMTVLTTLPLARLLSPEQFTLIAATTVVLGLFQMLIEVGLAPALVQKEEVDEAALSTTFWAALGLGLAAAAGIVALSGPSAALFGEPQAAPYLAVASLAVPIGFIASPAQALLFREFRFRALALASTTSALAYGVLAIGLAALTGLGVWAVIVARLAQISWQTGGTYLCARWRPRLVFDWPGFRGQLRFNVGYWATSMNAYVVKNADYWAVGRMAGNGVLGIYYMAYLLPNLIRQRMTWAVQNLMFSTFSRMQVETARLRRAYIEVLQVVGFVVFPVLTGLALVSEPLVAVFFGGRWLSAAAPMSILAVAAALSAIPPLTSSVLLARGRAGWNVFSHFVQLVTFLPGAVLAVRVGTLEAMAWAVAVSTGVRVVASWAILKREIKLPVLAGPRALRPIVLPIVVMVASVVALRAALPVASMAEGMTLLVLVASGVASYLGAGFVLSRETFLALTRQVWQILFGRSRQRAEEATRSRSGGGPGLRSEGDPERRAEAVQVL
jgi:O-antigen/teichoic acid export membrane protein